MALTPSTMLALGTEAPDFSLPEVATGRTVSLADLAGRKALLVMFLCRHCPYVKHVQDGLAKLCRDYQGKDIGMVGISSNDARAYPDDRPEGLAEQKRRAGFPFPYLHDETQEVAKAYRAACTPDFFLFDAGGRLVYRGQMDASRPENRVPVTGDDLRRAIDAVLAGGPVPGRQIPSMGCNIKWRPGNEPDYAR
jgi:peroxiredoxin